MNWFQSIVYGLISGFTEFLPLSSYAHQQIFMHLCGQNARDPAMDLCVHIALLLAVRSYCQPVLDQFARDLRTYKKGAVRNTRSLLDQRLVKQAAIPMLILFFILYYIFAGVSNILTASIGLLINGVLLFLPSRMLSGNKDSHSMSAVDSVMLGVAGSLSAVPGFSRLGCTVSFATMRGVDRKHALQWALLLSMHALGALVIIDLVKLFAGSGLSALRYILNYILAGIGAYFCGYLGIKFIRFITIKQDYSIFAYYCWGASLFAFILYLTVV